MLRDKLKNQLHLHLIVFIWGFTAILAALISIDALSLVWYRVLIGVITIFIYFKIKKISLHENLGDLIKFSIGGVIIAVHWSTFFHAIKISTISTTLITMSSSAFFVVLLKPFFGDKKIVLHEFILAILAVIGFVIIFKVENVYTKGIVTALISAFLIAVFSLYNSKLVKNYKASKIAFYELFFAFLFMSFVLVYKGVINFEFFILSNLDWVFIIILATVCTAYPFVVATNLLNKMSPFTIVLTNNLEPVYGIILAIIIFGDREKMSWQFYLGALIIFSSVLINAFLKNKKFKLRLKS
ncbi:MAG: DMT family transporter [Flavobacteriaceae bacterium]|nr:DMT family transporter [Flavobacteriaceae bacterium]